jgi:hypothetical protein
MSKRVNVTLGDEHAAMLSRLADRAHVSDGTLAKSLLTAAIENADADAGTVTEILEGVPGLVGRVEAAEKQVERGEYSELSDLA